MLFDTLRTSNSSFKEIILSDNEQIDDRCTRSIGEYIKINKSIEEIRLSFTSISDAGIEILVPYLEGNTAFKKISFNWNRRITDKSTSLLVKMIESSQLVDVDVEYTSILQKGTIFISLICNKIRNGLTKLDLPSNGLNDDYLMKICDALQKYEIDKLKEIDLNNNKITSKGASRLFDTLRERNAVVSKLILYLNQLDDDCMKSLGEYVQNNESLQEIRLYKNLITDKGIVVLSESLIGNTTLRELTLSDNKGITNASVPYLVDIAKKSSIIKLDLMNVSINFRKKEEIEKALKTPVDLRELPIVSNAKSAAKISIPFSIVC